MQIHINISDAVLRARMAALYNEVIPYIKTSQRQLARWALDRVKEYTPISKSPYGSSSTIRDAWTMAEPDEQDPVAVFTIHNIYRRMDVVEFFEYGTRPHIIRPVRARALHFMTYEGDEVWSKLVHHPGTPAYHMVERAGRDVELKLDQYIEGTFAMVDRMLSNAAARVSGLKEL